MTSGSSELGDEAATSELHHDLHVVTALSVGGACRLACSELLLPVSFCECPVVVTGFVIWASSSNLLYNLIGTASSVDDSGPAVDSV